MKNTNYMMTASDVARVLQCSKGHAYVIIREANEILSRDGYFVVAGKVPSAYFATKFYGYTQEVM